MKEKFVGFTIAICICGSWVLFDFINLKVFGFLKTEPFLYAIYWLAGYRILAIVLFGYVGFLGIFLGYVLSGIYLRNFIPMDAICLGLLSSGATLISYKIWQKFIGQTNAFIGVSFRALFYLVVLTSTITASFRSMYLGYIDKSFSLELFFGTLAANISGALILLYGIKILAQFIRHVKNTSD